MQQQKAHIATQINGETVEFLCRPSETLLEALRETLHLTGTKEGCGTGDCGACTVVLDNRLVCSCLVLAAEVHDRQIETIEGMAGRDPESGDPVLHPLQRHFLREAALQCGVCTPGFLIAAKALLDRNPSPTEAEIRYWLSGNLCRCTGYDKIVRAVQEAVAEIQNPPRNEERAS